jgi:hypothetical protein
VIHQRTAIAFLRNPVSAKVGEISSNGIVIVEEALRPAPADEGHDHFTSLRNRLVRRLGRLVHHSLSI